MIEYKKPEFPDQHTVVVSGCGAPRGIARVTARHLAAEGWNVVPVDISDKVLEFGGELATEYPAVKVLAVKLDISNEDEVAAAFARIAEEMPPLVGLANIAGIACPTSLAELGSDEFDRVMAVNCRGTMLMMKYGAEEMKKSGVGRIVNFSSITALDGEAPSPSLPTRLPRQEFLESRGAALASSASLASIRTVCCLDRLTRTSWVGSSPRSARRRCRPIFRLGALGSPRNSPPSCPSCCPPAHHLSMVSQ
jgi:Short-chain alcohol dehydrogenase of unknown specificity